MSITASMVKELRERTGAGMMECKRALVETSGDTDAAAEALRKSGQAKADKKAGRVAADGKVVIAREGSKAIIVEINDKRAGAVVEPRGAAFLGLIGHGSVLILDEQPVGQATLLAEIEIIEVVAVDIADGDAVVGDDVESEVTGYAGPPVIG